MICLTSFFENCNINNVFIYFLPSVDFPTCMFGQCQETSIGTAPFPPSSNAQQRLREVNVALLCISEFCTSFLNFSNLRMVDWVGR